jgi:hypothetical protein
MPFDLAGIGPGKPVKGRHISDLYAGLTGGLADQPITVFDLTVQDTLTVNGVEMALVSQAMWDALLARVTALENAVTKDVALRQYIQTIMAVIDPGAPPPP